MENKELTILLPVLNEEKTIGICIEKAQRFINKYKINAEILVADNNSTDNSCKIAKNMNANIIHVKEKGYGNALINGIKKARGTYIIMADADDSYDLEHLEKFMEKLHQGYELVMGNRFKGGIEKSAMPFSHKIGIPVLSFIGRCVCKSKVGDFHCGIRGFKRQAILDLNLECSGMEFASEMIVKAEKEGLNIVEIPTTLKKDGRGKKSHLKTFSDGWRHLKFLIKSITV
jgi:glycosyltransferase involved in cell wall biosynthesis